MEFPQGLGLVAICQREEPRDALVSGGKYSSVLSLPQGAVVGTSSLRRKVLLLAIREDLIIKPLRGNVNTRLRKLADGDFDAIVLAASGLQRLELSDEIDCLLEIEDFLPAGGQGALGIECRFEDTQTRALISQLNHDATAKLVYAERAMNGKLGGSCQAPIASHAVYRDGQDQLHLRGMVGAPDGSNTLFEAITGPSDQYRELGNTLAEQLIAAGADDILKQIS